MNYFERNAFRAIKKSWGTYAGAACIIALGIFVYVSMMDTLNNLRGQVEAYYEQSHLADLFAVVSAMPEEELLELEELPGVETAFGRLSQDVRVLTEDGDNFVSVHLLAYDSGDRLNCITVDGAGGSDSQSIWIGRRMMAAYGWEQGQNLRLMIEGSAVEFTVAGGCGAPDYVYSVPPSGAMIPDGALYDVAAIPKERFEELFSRKGQVNEIGIALEPGTASEDVRYAVRLCFKTWQMTDTRMPTAAILKIRFTPMPASSRHHHQEKQPRRHPQAAVKLRPAFHLLLHISD